MALYSIGQMTRRVRDYCFTLNNYTDEECDAIKQTECRYIIFGKEIAPTTGTPHLQGYIYFDEKKSMTYILKLKGWNRVSLREAKGNADQNKTYTSKDGDVFEKGEKPNQGKRQDLNQVYDRIRRGENLDRIIDECPDTYLIAHRVMDRLEDIHLRNRLRNFMTEGEWVFGPSGVGKSEYAFQAPGSKYIWADDGDWWDGYRGQDLVIIDEFRGQLAYNKLLKMVDKHPNFYVRRRGREPMPFISKKVIITSSMPPWKVYKNLDPEDSFKQLFRRFKIYEISTEGLKEHTWEEWEARVEE